MAHSVTLLLSLTFAGGLGLMALLSSPSRTEALASGDCRLVEVRVDEGYGVSGMALRQVCGTRR